MHATFKSRRKQLAVALTCAALFSLQSCQPNPGASTTKPSAAPVARDDAASRAAFLAAYPVFMHPRCMNCHPDGDVPLQGEDSHLHIMNVKRGADGKGVFAMRCTNCHQLTNLPGVGMPPGNPVWHLPPADIPMVFQNRTPAQLAKQLKDPKQNGGRTLEQILLHVSEDQLVTKSGWSPPEGRAAVPMPQKEFVEKMREWVEKGAAIPE